MCLDEFDIIQILYYIHTKKKEKVPKKKKEKNHGQDTEKTMKKTALVISS